MCYGLKGLKRIKGMREKPICEEIKKMNNQPILKALQMYFNNDEKNQKQSINFISFIEKKRKMQIGMNLKKLWGVA